MSCLDGTTERCLSYLRNLRHLKMVSGYSTKTVRAWVNSEKRIASEWATSAGGQLSLRLLVPADPIPKAEPLWLIGELRNNTNKPITTQRPFGAFPEPRQRISLQGPAGPIKLVALFYDISGCGDYSTVPPNGSIRDSLELTTSQYLGSYQPGTYKISYHYKVDSHDVQRVKRFRDLDAIWQGSIQSETVTIRKE